MQTASKTRDARVEAAIAHWAPRFVANGVPLTDFQEVTGAIERWEDWCGAWSRRAMLHEELGNEALGAGHRLAASEQLTRAAMASTLQGFQQQSTANRDAQSGRGASCPCLPAWRVASLAPPHV